MKYWIALVGCLTAVFGFTACGDDDSPEDTRASQIGSLSESAVDSWVANGVTGLYNFLDSDIKATCSVESLEEALADQSRPTAWRNTKDIAFPTEETASATVIIVQDGSDVEQAWTFGLELGVRWRLTGFPGLAECTS